MQVGPLAAGTIGFAALAHAQNIVSGSQTVHSQAVGVKGSNVLSDNDKGQTNVLTDSDAGNISPWYLY